MAKPIEITIGAAFAGSFAKTVTGAQNSLQRLGSTISRIGNTQAGVGQMQNLSASANQLGRSYGAAKQRAEQLRAALAGIESPTKAQIRELERADAATEKARLALERQREALRSLKGELQAAGVNTKNLTSESVRLGNQMEVLRQRSAALAKAQAAQQANRDKRGQLMGDMFGMVAVGTTLAAPAKLAIGFEDQMARVGAVSNATQQQLVALTAKAREMGRDTRYTARQAGEGMMYLAMAGFNAQQQIDAIGGVLTVAAAAGADLGRTSDIVSNALTGFGLSAAESTRVGDVLTKTFTSSNTTLESLGETLKYVAPVATAAGASIELVSAMAGVMGDAGIQGTMAGTAMRSMFTRMVAPAKDAKKHMAQMGITAAQMAEIMADPETQAAAQHIKQMGIQVADENGNLRDWMDILTELSVKMENLSEQERLSAATAIFGKPALAGGLAIMASLKKDEKYIEEQVANMRAQGVAEEKIAEYRIKTRNKLQDRLNKNMGSGGFAAQVATRMEDTTGGSLRVMRSAIEDLSIAIGNVLSPSIRNTAGNITALANTATVLVERFPVLSRVVFVGAGAALALGIAWKALGYAWTVTKAPFLSANTMLQQLRAQMALTTLAAEGGPVKFGVLGNALRSLLPSIFAVNTALYANPIVWIGAAIAGAAVLIYKYWEPLKAFFGGLFSGISQGFAAFAPVGAVFTAIADAVKGVWEWLTQLFEPVKLTSDEFTALTSSGQAVGEVIGSVLAGAVKLVLLPLETLISGLKWLKGLVSGDEAPATQPSDATPQSVTGNTKTITHNNQPQINITVPPGTDAQGVADAARTEVQKAMESYSEMGWMYDY
ncbi:phage tail tape measure protein [uncultured Desulfovibrio sp.]|uniref:phage tail tape measure protein n=1 Tax=uncultured Desulfovibrio sp. TaxID=167968 RepID=UPI0026239E42|nr:phage tail tape measure protein [uncultured Desulfovibrio sp.]